MNAVLIIAAVNMNDPAHTKQVFDNFKEVYSKHVLLMYDNIKNKDECPFEVFDYIISCAIEKTLLDQRTMDLISENIVKKE